MDADKGGGGAEGGGGSAGGRSAGHGSDEHAAPRKLELEVGAFVLLGVFLAAVAIFLLGQKSHLFKQRVTLHAEFPNVQGLKEGAPVRLSGVDVGTVSRVAFSRDRKNQLVRVDLLVSRDALLRIGADSIARIGAQGLLGDKLIDISLASVGAAPLHPSDTVKSVPPVDINHLVEQVTEVLDRTRLVAERATDAIDSIANPAITEDIRASVASVRRLLRATERGSGLAHAIFYDKTQARELSAAIAEFSHLTHDADRSVRRINAILETTSPEGAELVNNVSQAARSVGQTAADLHRSRVIQNLEKASADVAAMTTYARTGQGTLGALLLDPTVYDQLVTVLGGIARSRILRALVRIGIARDEGRHVGQHAVQKQTR